MKKGYENNRWKVVMAGLSITAMIGCAVCGSLAWLTYVTTPVTNTFTHSNIEIKLQEGENLDLQMVPGDVIAKDPKAWVVSGSEECFLFVVIDAKNGVKKYDDATIGATDYIIYNIDDGWTLVDGETNVYWREVTKDSIGKNFAVLGSGTYTDQIGIEEGIYLDKTHANYTWADNEVLVLPSVTEEMMKTAQTAKPSLSFTAYAVQSHRNSTAKFNAKEAWAVVDPDKTTTPDTGDAGGNTDPEETPTT